jgi:1-deoxy-D-xylulose-5-phosphate reductoisomerase
MAKKKFISLLGSTGSIGINSLKVIKNINAEVVALAVKNNIDLLEEQISEFNPKIVAVYDEIKAEELKKRITGIKILSGMKGVIEVASITEANFVISAISGALGLLPTIAAIDAGKDVGLANKEVLVCAGEYVVNLCKKRGVKLLPIDSEHSAILQCLKREKKKEVKRLILTASGGPFFQSKNLEDIDVDKALLHPTYSMGKKISVDSSTLMNKGLEMIEAHYLFDIDIDKIDAVIHPQSIIHSLVEFVDGSMLAQMAYPDMRLPIQYALTYPKREKGFFSFDFQKYSKLEFFPIDEKKFKCFSLAKEALRIKKSMPCYMNAVNEVLVNKFLNKEISWLAISDRLEKLMSLHSAKNMVNLEDIIAVDQQARYDAHTN